MRPAFDRQDTGNETHRVDPEVTAEVEETSPKARLRFRFVSPGATDDENCTQFFRRRLTHRGFPIRRGRIASARSERPGP